MSAPIDITKWLQYIPRPVDEVLTEPGTPSQPATLATLRRRLTAIEAEMGLRRKHYVGAETTMSYTWLANSAAVLRDALHERDAMLERRAA
jgi:hypothetical protein